jgi:UDP-N-acetyl-2-amino-2-deoxyglucuronate dehydrogenase
MNMTNLGDKKIRFGVIGCGNIGPRHMVVIQEETRAELAAICDCDENRLATIAHKYPGIDTYTDFESLLKHPSLDLVSICTPHDLHAPMAIAAAKAGKNVLVEKPMAIKLEDAQAMTRAARENNVRLMVVKQNRYNVPVVLTREALKSGKLGEVYMVQCNVFWNRYQGYYSDSQWRGRKVHEGGALFTQASHFIDLLLWLFGDIIQADTRIETKSHSIEIEDCGTANVRFSSGVMGSLSWTTSVFEKNYEGSITIIGELGTIKIGGQYLNTIEYWDVKDSPLPVDVKYDDLPNAYGKYQGTSSNHHRVIHDVVSDLLNNSSATVQGDEGIKTVKAIEFIYQCVRN